MDIKNDKDLVGCQCSEQILERLSQLEQQQEERVLHERIDRLDRNPAAAKSWKEIRRETHD